MEEKLLELPSNRPFHKLTNRQDARCVVDEGDEAFNNLTAWRSTSTNDEGVSVVSTF